MIRQGSRSFFAASLLLPSVVRDRAYSLYAFCRLADDAVDFDNAAGDALARLSERLACAYSGQPYPTPADRAFADLVAAQAIPRELPEALLEGFAWDAEGRRYEDLSALRAYAARVAGTVGAMMALLMGVRDASVVARACDLGVAMQLTNIARDVGEDARMGRIYLPLAWMREAGIDPAAWLAQPVFDTRLASVVQRLLAAADELYERSVPGIAALPFPCRPGILAARTIYAEIGREVERCGLDSVSRRAVVSTRQKLWLLAQAFATAPFAPAGPAEAPAPALEETRFLVDAVTADLADTPAGASEAFDLRWWDIEGRFVWVLDLFERMERRRTAGSSLAESDRQLANGAGKAHVGLSPSVRQEWPSVVQLN
jgi:phytoene synthase